MWLSLKSKGLLGRGQKLYNLEGCTVKVCVVNGLGCKLKLSSLDVISYLLARSKVVIRAVHR